MKAVLASYLGIIESLEPTIIDRVQIPVSCWTKNVVLLNYVSNYYLY
jgi:hypothetical protein